MDALDLLDNVLHDEHVVPDPLDILDGCVDAPAPAAAAASTDPLDLLDASGPRLKPTSLKCWRVLRAKNARAARTNKALEVIFHFYLRQTKKEIRLSLYCCQIHLKFFSMFTCFVK